MKNGIFQVWWLSGKRAADRGLTPAFLRKSYFDFKNYFYIKLESGKSSVVRGDNEWYILQIRISPYKICISPYKICISPYKICISPNKASMTFPNSAGKLDSYTPLAEQHFCHP